MHVEWTFDSLKVGRPVVPLRNPHQPVPVAEPIEPEDIEPLPPAALQPFEPMAMEPASTGAGPVVDPNDGSRARTWAAVAGVVSAVVMIMLIVALTQGWFSSR